MPDEEVDPSRMSPWLLRIELNREMMVDKKLSHGGRRGANHRGVPRRPSRAFSTMTTARSSFCAFAVNYAREAEGCRMRTKVSWRTRSSSRRIEAQLLSNARVARYSGHQESVHPRGEFDATQRSHGYVCKSTRSGCSTRKACNLLEVMSARRR